MTTFGKIRLDKDGTWYHNDTEVIHENINKLFHKSIIKKNNSFFLKIDNQEVPIEVEDVVLWVVNVEINQDKSEIKLFLSNESVEIINHDKIKFEINSENILYCYFKDQKVKFTKKSYYNITKYLIEQDSKFFIVVGKLKIPINEL